MKFGMISAGINIWRSALSIKWGGKDDTHSVFQHESQVSSIEIEKVEYSRIVI